MRDDGNQVGRPAQGRIAAGYLHAGSRAVGRGDGVDTAEQLGQGHVVHRLRYFGEVAERAVEIAALCDLQRDATDRPSTPKQQTGMPLAGVLHPRSACRQWIAVIRTPRIEVPGGDLLRAQHL